MTKSFIWFSFISASLSLVITSSSFSQDRTIYGPQECYSSVAAAATEDGIRYGNKGEHEKALAAYQKAQKAEPTCSAAYNNLGAAYYKLGRHNEAITSFEQALQFKPSWAWVLHFNVSRSKSALGQLQEAVRSLDEAIGLNPKEASILRSRANLYLRLGQGNLAAADAESFLKLRGWRDKSSLYAVILAYFGHSRSDDAKQARQVLDEAVVKGKKADWPYPVVRFLRNEISSAELLSEEKDLGRLTEIHAYIGMNLSLFAEESKAREHLKWVIDHGKKTFTEYGFAVSELERISRSSPSK